MLAEGHQVPGLCERIAVAIAVLREKADISDNDPRIRDFKPNSVSADVIRKVADELEGLVAGLDQ